MSMLKWFAGGYVVLYVWVWGSLIYRLWDSSPPSFVLPTNEAVLVVAGFVAASVGAGMAATLGIEVQKAYKKSNVTTARVALREMKPGPHVGSGIAAYALVGLALLVTWMVHPEESPELVEATAMGYLGFFAGAFAAVFKADK